MMRLLLTSLALVLMTACAERQDATPGPSPAADALQSAEKLVFMAGFKPQANLPFVAVYVAQERGYFREEGLDVEIRHAATGEHLKLLMSGDVDVTTAAASSVLKRRADPGLPVVAFALFGQRGQQAYVALESSGMRTPKDWEGKTFGYRTSVPPDYLAMLSANGVDRSKIREVNAGFDVRVLTEGRVDLLAVFKSNEPDTIRRLGFEVLQWSPEDFGVDNIGLTFITREDMVAGSPDRLARFLRATLRAMEDIQADPDGAVSVVMKYAPEEDRDHQRFMLQAEMADAFGPVTGAHGFGWMTDEQWKVLHEQLVQFDALPEFDYRAAYTHTILRAAREDKPRTNTP
ncbi:MAG: ABC transporter substrate-binding protein [SAR202 cluster bacterium]|nr:ABC transporter substrate-binding protein [SAR202 cluster bacterium]